MPAPVSAEEMLGLIRKSELVPAGRIEAALLEIPDYARKTPREFCDRLITLGVITRFQSEQFLQGKWRGFSIGRYRVLERLGSGGMGTVYLAEHAVVGKKVAVKVLPVNQANNPAALGRFYREARAAAALDHPNIVHAYDIDEDAGLHFLIMDYVDGSSLQEMVAKAGPLSVLCACDYVRQAALGLQHAHENGLIHRDVKPANLMVERNGIVRLLDLGLARFYEDHTDQLTMKYDEKHVLGTADYVSPEQALDSHEVDQRTDIYSLGATFYFLLTGKPPFPEGKVAQKLIWHQVRQPTSVRQMRPEVPEAVAAVLEKMMAKEADDRYQTHQEVADALAVLCRQPVPPPSDEEMPKLCPAALSGMVVTNMPPGSRPVRRKGPRQAQTAPESGQVATLQKDPTGAEVSTPRALTRDTVRAEQQPDAVSPSRLLETPAPSSGWVQTVLLVGLLAVGSALIGAALTVWPALK
jgi:serine/threonine protein kinase